MAIDNLDELLKDEGLQAKIAEQARLIAEQELGGIKNKNAELLSEIKKLKGLKNSIPEGFDPDEFKKLKEAEVSRAQQEAEKKGEWDKLRSHMAEKHQGEVATLSEQLNKSKRALENHMLDSQVTSALAKVEGSIPLLSAIVKSSLKVVDNDGKYGVVVVDTDGTPRLGGSDGSPMSIDQFISELAKKPEYMPAFGGTKAAGSGAVGGRGAGRPHKNISDMSITEKTALISEIGQAEYNKRRRAGK